MSGVLLAFKLACVSIRRTDRLSIVKGMRCCCCFLFFFLAFLLWGEVAVHVSFQYLTYSHGVGGGGWGTIAIFTDALGTHQHRDITTTGCRPSDTFKRRERLAFFSQVILTSTFFYPAPDSFSSFSSTFLERVCTVGFLSNTSPSSYFPLHLQSVCSFFKSSFGKAGCPKLTLNQTHMWIVA